jgi:ribosomal protein S18 acetylase RimI-like enzyme
MNGIQVRRMTTIDLDAAFSVIGLAFADNPNTLMLARGDRDRAERMMRAVVRVAKLSRKWSHVLVAVAASDIVGVLNAAEWPNCQLRAWEKLRTAPALIGAMGSAIPRALKMTGVWAKQDPQRPHWHIGPLGVSPDHQGHGIGKALLAKFLETVDGNGSPAYLETDVERNVALYEKFGFKVVARADIAGVDNRFMWRDASSRAS